MQMFLRRDELKPGMKVEMGLLQRVKATGVINPETRKTRDELSVHDILIPICSGDLF